MNILLVEDNKADVKIALRAFAGSKLKNEIHVVNDGEEALAFILHQGKYQDETKYPTPDLILLDINMPKINGFQFLDTLKQNLEYGYIPVIMLTSSKNEEDIAKSYKKGAASYIPKPINYDEFVKIVEGFSYYWRVINKLPSSDKNGV